MRRIGPIYFENKRELIVLFWFFAFAFGVLQLAGFLVWSFLADFDLRMRTSAFLASLKLTNGRFDFVVYGAEQPIQTETPDHWGVDLGVVSFGYTGSYQAPSTINIHGSNFYQISISIWFLLIVHILPLLFLGPYLWRREHRRRHNRCVFCGFDLTGSDERCPECGRGIVAP